MKRTYLLGALVLVSCQQNAVKTPSRVLAQPSDSALFCVDFEFDAQAGACPAPQPAPGAGASESDLRAYLDYYCSFTPPSADTLPPPSATLLALEECGDLGRRRHRDRVQKDIRDAAQRLGRSLDFPCCDPDTTCTNQPNVCSRRKLEALVTNTGQGEVAVVDTEAVADGQNTVGLIQNLQSGRPGFGFLPVGLKPDHVRTASPPQPDPAQGRALSPAAYGVVTNPGSCDLSMIGLGNVVRLMVQQSVPEPPVGIQSPATCESFKDDQVVSCRVAPWVSDRSQPLQARPAYVEVAPWGDRRALVAYPGCGLVADIDLRSGRVLEALRWKNGQPTHLGPGQLGVIACSAECASGQAGGAVVPAESGPVALAVDGDGQRLLIAHSGEDQLTLVDYDPAAADGQHLARAPRRLALEFPSWSAKNQRGLDGVRVGPRGAAGLFAYARARDNTVRVVDLDGERECETNPDARQLQKLAISGEARVLPDEAMSSNLRRLGCFSVGQVARAPLASSPGISLPGGAVPVDVAFTQFGLTCDPADSTCGFNKDAAQENWIASNPALWVGDFAWILGSNGRALAVQIADRCPGPSLRACDAEQAARRRAALLFGPSPKNPSGTGVLAQAVSVSPLDRLGNQRRNLSSRFQDSGTVQLSLGPRVELDAEGLPVVRPRIDATGVPSQVGLTLQGATAEQQVTVRPDLVRYPYLPVDPVCDLALKDASEDAAARPLSVAAFPHPGQVSSELWSLEWEGRLLDPGEPSRITGKLESPGAMQLTDLGGSYCAKAVEPGDKLYLSGCQRNEDCLPGHQCARELTRLGSVGVCVRSAAEATECRALSRALTTDPQVEGQDPTVWAGAWRPRYRIVRAEEASTGNRLKLAEIAAPEYALQQQRCEGQKIGQACAASVFLPAVEDATTRRGADGRSYRERVTVCRVDHDERDQPLRRCLVDCDTSDDCGSDYMCVRSSYEVEEERAGDYEAGYAQKQRGRCVRAPLLDQNTGVVSRPRRAGDPPGGGSYTLTRGGALVQQVLDKCFPDSLRYDLHAGDAFLVRGSVSGVLGYSRARGGQCLRPAPGDPDYEATRLLQPRLRLGGRATDAKALCPAAPAAPADLKSGWVSHWLPPRTLAAPSCDNLLRAGTVTLPNDVTLSVVRASDRWTDAAVQREYQLLSSLDRQADLAPSCVLYSGEAVEPRDCAADPTRCSRTIHFENPVLNLVLQVPRLVLLNGSSPAELSAAWAVPEDGYSVSFQVLGGATVYALPAAPRQGQLAQGLRTATAAPDGSVFVVDQGSNGSAAGLRGQFMRLVRGGLDNNFLVR